MQFLKRIIRHFGNSNINTWILIILVIVWGISVYVFPTKLNAALDVELGKTLSRANEALKQLNKTSKKNDELKKIIEYILNDLDNIQQLPVQENNMDNMDNPLDNKIVQNSYNIGVQPISEYEQLRRRVRQNTEELWNYFSSEFDKIRNNSATTDEVSDHIVDSVLKLGAEHKRSLILDIDQMRSVDGYELWRHQEAADLSDLVQRRLSYLQNPRDCKNANKLVCNMNDNHGGYGSELHHIVYCFIVAYITERTMIFKSKGWKYNKAGWEDVFQPISETCTEYERRKARKWPAGIDTKILILPEVDKIRQRSSYLPLAIPADLAPRITKLHGDPNVWWISQFLKYILKPNHETHEMLEICMEKLGWKRPIVGIHIRRTNGNETTFYPVEEYMTYVEEYYLKLDMTSSKKYERRVYLASDDPRVITEARIKYPHYKIIGDGAIAKTAGFSTRYTKSSLNGIILDIHLLSLSDHLVCAFSSNVCRAAYEIMQTYYPDASDRIKSLDNTYYYSGQSSLNRESVLAHKPSNKDELFINPGDLIRFARNHWDGFSKGINIRTYEKGLFPSFKVKNKIKIDNYPTYSNAD